MHKCHRISAMCPSDRDFGRELNQSEPPQSVDEQNRRMEQYYNEEVNMEREREAMAQQRKEMQEPRQKAPYAPNRREYAPRQERRQDAPYAPNRREYAPRREMQPPVRQSYSPPPMYSEPPRMQAPREDPRPPYYAGAEAPRRPDMRPGLPSM
jgi:hypothetical protein